MADRAHREYLYLQTTGNQIPPCRLHLQYVAGFIFLARGMCCSMFYYLLLRTGSYLFNFDRMQHRQKGCEFISSVLFLFIVIKVAIFFGVMLIYI